MWGAARFRGLKAKPVVSRGYQPVQHGWQQGHQKGLQRAQHGQGLQWSPIRLCSAAAAPSTTSSSSSSGSPLPPSGPAKMDFNDPTRAFQSKTTSELLLAWAVFRVCGIPWVVRHSDKLIAASLKVLRGPLTYWFIRRTFFAHFCAGQSEKEILPTVDRLSKHGIGGILDYAAESDLQESEALERTEVMVEEEVVARQFDYTGEEGCDKNADIFVKCIESVAKMPKKSFAAVKITALGKPELLEKLSTVLMAIRKLFKDFKMNPEGMITRKEFATKIKEFGVDIPEHDLNQLFSEFDLDGNGEIDYIEWTHGLTIEHMTSPIFTDKPGMRHVAKAGQLPMLNQKETRLFNNMVSRVHRVAKAAVKARVRLMIDAEQTYLQPAIDNMTLELQRNYNIDFPYIFSTYQCYLQWSKQHLLNDLERSKRQGWIFAGKLVRGAYMVLERKRAEDMGYISPILDTIEDTHANYNECIQIVMDNIHRSNLVIASHNQASVETAIEQMLKKNAPKDRVFFAQLLGMSDHLSFTLGQNGYEVYKYIPYGPVHEVIPYLIRRAQENSSLMESADHELSMIQTELKRRLINM